MKKFGIVLSLLACGAAYGATNDVEIKQRAASGNWKYYPVPDPGADSFLYWDESDSAVKTLALSTKVDTLETETAETVTEASPDTISTDLTVRKTVATIDENTTLSFAATPSTGTKAQRRYVNSTASAVTLTIPSSYSEAAGGNITSFIVPANGEVTVWFERLASSYRVYGDPVPVVRTAFIPVGWMRDGATAPSAIEDYADTRKVAIRDFSNSADNILEFLWQLPVDITDGDAGTAGFQVKWRPIYMITTTAPASNEGVTFGLAGASVGDSDDFGATVGTESDSAFANLDGHAQGDIVYGTYSSITITDGAAGEGGVFSLRRDQADSNDDYAQTVGLIGIEIKYKAAATATY